MSQAYNTDPRQRYDGPEFGEFCISENGYLSARRDRAACISCELSKLCQAGFNEQVQRVMNGRDASLTKDCELTLAELTPEKLLKGLSSDQQDFVKKHIAGL